MVKTRKHSSRKAGGGYMTSQQWFNPDVLPPQTILVAPSTAPTSDMIRPVLLSSFQSPLLQSGGKTRKQKHHGGFSPSIMGPFIANAKAAIVPLAGYLVYQTVIPKKGAVSKKKSKQSKQSKQSMRK